MINKLFWNQEPQPHLTRLQTLAALAVCILGTTMSAMAGDAPAWMHALVNAPLPEHDEKTDAVLLYSETSVNIISADKIKTVERRVYKILRPEGRYHGTAVAYFRSPGEKINGLRGWCIPAQGKDYEV